MGWVEQEFIDEQTYRQGVPALWDAIRDSIGLAVAEFNERLDGLQKITAADCTARGRWCRRISKADGSNIEIFFDEADRTLRTSTNSAEQPSLVCSYRLKKDRSGLELYCDSPDGTSPLSVDEGCRVALRSFLFIPFPKMFRDSGKIALL
jgi:hypothetical protein